MISQTQIKNCAIALSLLVLSACSITQPSIDPDYYLLQSQALNETTVDSYSAQQVIVIGPLRFADYLMRSSIVAKHSDVEYNPEKFEQWAGNIEDEFQIALLKNLAQQQQDSFFVRHPGLFYVGNAKSLSVDVLRFDVNQQGLARLEAQWIWLEANGDVNAVGNFSQTLQAKDLSRAGATQALSQLITSFSERVSQDH
ncbi:membrane integrity-associated transporter subunit PqiC [Alginatibacterium sediminis]|uniref:Membrane integrity-associated transporter subunit PqiC n=1 Tax=Alginatibacterium sediminis TaxID=2164068 RepID=A0A420EBN5_9ALTE|nr:PqiC family protein [Alginatibacterium sediminis]RKF18098.1 membrane integrity-associated transporter subunit PqiC [Alginatibacterium sediminis]